MKERWAADRLKRTLLVRSATHSVMPGLDPGIRAQSTVRLGT
jgi:hypothetical protein